MSFSGPQERGHRAEITAAPARGDRLAGGFPVGSHLLHRYAHPPREFENEVQILRDEVERERDRRTVGVLVGGPLVLGLTS
jgi:hypothetical protein